MTDSSAPLRPRVVRSMTFIAAVATLVVVAAVVALRGRALAEGAALWALEHAPADGRCGDRVGQLATLVQGGVLAPDACLEELAEGPLAAAVLTRVARDVSRPVLTRTSALVALLAAGTGPPELSAALIEAPASSPEMRRAAFAITVDGPGQLAWVERGAGTGLHGLYDRALARMFALGEPGLVSEVRGVLAATAARPDPGVVRDLYAGLGIDRAALEEAVARHARGQLPLGLPTEWRSAFWRHGCERECVPLLLELSAIEARRRGEEQGLRPPPTVPAADEALDLIYAADGAAADHVRAELTAVAGWIAVVDEARRAARLRAAVLHPSAPRADAESAAEEAGDPHAVLVRGGGSPGATALAAADLALASRVPLSVWATGDSAVLQIGGRFHEVRACSPPRVIQGADPAWREAPREGAEALALVEAAARALRRDDVVAARAQLEVARARWAEAPGLDAVDAARLALEGPVPPPPLAPPARRGRRTAPPPSPATPVEQVGALLGVPAPGSLLVSRPPFVPRGARVRQGPPDDRVATRAALQERAGQVLSLAAEASDRVRAAWWAARGGHRELARALVVAVGDPWTLRLEERRLRAAVLRAVGEPVAGTDGAGGAAGGSSQDEDAVPCLQPFRADPPPAAWRGGDPASLGGLEGARADGGGAPGDEG